MENGEVRKPFPYYGFRTLVYVLQFSVLQLPYFGFRISISVLPCSYFCISVLQRFPLAPTCDGSPGETTVSEYVIEDRQAFPWHLSQSYQETDYIE